MSSARAQGMPALRAVAGVVLVVTAYVGCIVLPTAPTLGAALLAVAAVAFGVSFVGAPQWKAARLSEVKLPVDYRLSSAGITLVALGVTFTIVLVVLVNRREVVSAYWTLPIWCLSMTLFLAGLLPAGSGGAYDRVGGAALDRATRWEGVAVAAIVVAGFVLRAYALERYPDGMHGDEGEFGLEALSILRGDRVSPFETGFLGHPRLIFFLQALSLKLFGTTLTGLRMLSSLSGTALLVLLYVSVRCCFGRRVALLATALQAVSATDIHFSRLALNNIQTPLFWVPAFALLLTGLRSGRLLDFGASGVLAGLSLHFYFASRLVPVILAVFFLYAALTRRGLLRGYYLHLLAAAAGLIVAFAPLALFFLHHPDELTARAVHNSIFQNWQSLVQEYQTQSVVGVLWNQVGRALLAFVGRGELSTFYPTTEWMLDPAVQALFFLGLALTTLRWRSLRYGLLTVWVWLTFVFGGVFSINMPYVPRLVGLWPAVFVLAAIAVDEVLQAAQPLVRPSFATIGGTLAGAALVGMTAWGQLTGYFGRFGSSHPWSNVTLQARYVADMRDHYVVYVVGHPEMYLTHGATQFLAHGVEGGDLLEPEKQLPVALPRNKGLVFLVYPHREEMLPVLRRHYPQGSERVVFCGTGEKAFTAFFAQPETPGVAGRAPSP